MNFILGLLYGIAAQILTFTQLQGQFKFEWAKTNPFYMALMGVPISLLYFKLQLNLFLYIFSLYEFF